jgi:hypothetical protein
MNAGAGAGTISEWTGSIKVGLSDLQTADKIVEFTRCDAAIILTMDQTQDTA